MDFKFSAFLAFILCCAVTGTPTRKRNATCEIDLLNESSGSGMSKRVKYELNNTILHYQNGKTYPTTLASNQYGGSNATCNPFSVMIAFGEYSIGKNIVEHLNITDLASLVESRVYGLAERAEYVLKNEFEPKQAILHYRNGKTYLPLFPQLDLKHRWTPAYVILFGGENPLNLTREPLPLTDDLVILASENDRLMIFGGEGIDWRTEYTIAKSKTSKIPDKIKRSGGPMNGFIIPPACGHRFIVHWTRTVHYSMFVLFGIFSQRKHVKSIVFIYSGKEDEIRNMLEHTKTLSDTTHAAVGVVAQPDFRGIERFEWQHEAVLLAFNSLAMKSSTIVVNETDSNETLKAKFQDCKEKLSVLESEQTMAFHFKVVNGAETDNSTKIFSEMFPDVPVSTLNIRNNSTVIGVWDEGRFQKGSFYVIIAFPTWS